MHTNFIQDKIEAEAEDLILFIENDHDLYFQRFVPIIKNIQRRKKRGDYDHSKAPKLWSYIVDAGAKKYHKECKVLNYKWHEQFPKEVRNCASHLFANKYLEEIFFNGYEI